MNPLLEQFLTEARELVEHSSHFFLQLEKSPQDSETLNGLFRYIHTLKGGSGLFDIGPFTQLVHVAEDSLDKARDGVLVIEPDGIDLYLDVLDQLSEWLNELESSETLSAHANDASNALIKQINQRILKLGSDTEDGQSTANTLKEAQSFGFDQCIEKLAIEQLDEPLKISLRKDVEALTEPASLIKYSPEPNAFFSGEDPVSFWSGVPDLVWQSITSDFQHSKLEEFDPYDCRLSFLGLSKAKESDIRQVLDYVWPNVQVLPVSSAPSESETEDDPAIYKVLSHQRLLLEHLHDNPQPLATLASIERVVKSLSEQTSSLQSLPEVRIDANLNPEFKPALEALLANLSNQDLDNAAAAVNAEQTAGSKDLIPQITDEPVSKTAKSSDASRSDSIRNIKVDQERLEQLVDLTGELIVAKNSLQHLARRVEQDYGIKALTNDIKSEHAVLNRITESLQDVVMQIRMIPVSTIFQRFPRLVRDLSRRLGKDIELRVEGEETEADKNIVEQLADPLIHLVRNSIDHGIEMPDVRQERGKQQSGIIRLVAKNVQESVQIEIHDDGAGIDPQVIKNKAISKGVISEEQAQKMADEELLQLIFEPGFSTCEQVSDLSGRGVGMDVVKTTVNRLGGTIDLHSVKNEGSVITVNLPASITVTRVMMFEVDDQVYGIPVEGLTETIKISPEKVRSIKRGEAYVLRDQFIPLYRMHQLLGLRQKNQAAELPILNLNINGMVAGFVVDKLLEGVDVIIKPLEGVMSRFPIYSGAAVLGDGRVLLVINPKEMALCH